MPLKNITDIDTGEIGKEIVVSLLKKALVKIFGIDPKRNKLLNFLAYSFLFSLIIAFIIIVLLVI